MLMGGAACPPPGVNNAPFVDAADPIAAITACWLRSSTNLSRRWAMLPAVKTTGGVWAPLVPFSDGGAIGVEEPELFCVARREAASRREASEMICLTFLLRRWGGFHCWLRNGLGTLNRSSLSRSSWWFSSFDEVVIGAILMIERRTQKTTEKSAGW